MNSGKGKAKSRNHKYIIHLFFSIASIVFFIFPFYMMIATSLTDENVLTKQGYQLFPEQLSFEAYRYVFANPKEIYYAYATTIGQSLIGTLLSVTIMALCSYAMSRSDFIFRKPLSLYIIFTMIFSGGLVPTYILNASYLHLRDNLLIYLVSPYLCNVFYMIVLRTYFRDLPVALIESAKIDGAGELKIFSRIIVPLSKPVLATISLFVLLDRWNEWYTSLLYINNSKYYTVQYLLQRVLLELDFLRNLTLEAPIGSDNINIPSESMRYAMAVVVAGPMLIVFPFFQKYFVKGLTVGAVKG
jgi:putative aldouronate transport system permease protein